MSAINAQPGLAKANPDERGRTGADIRCEHCGLAVPPALLDDTRDAQFCCRGCETVYSVLRSNGLKQYYALREATGAATIPATTSGRKFSEFDDPAFTERYVRPRPDGPSTVELQVEGVHCAACAWLIERLPRLVTGVHEARLDLRRGVVTVTWDADRTPLSAVARQLDSLGYTPHPCRGQADDLRRREDRRYLIRIAVAGALAGNVMLLAFALYGGMFHGMEAQYRLFFRWTSLGLALIAVLWPGRSFFTSAFNAMRVGRVHMDVPIALGLGAAMAWSIAATVSDSSEVYFDCVTMLVFLLLIGRWIQMRQQRSSADAMQLLFTLTPNSARRVDDGLIRAVPADAVQIDDVLEVLPDETIPVDGEVIDGHSTLDESLLTGESMPINIAPGDIVRAGTVNRSSPIRMRAQATGEDTRVGRIMKLVEEAARQRSPIVHIADRIAGVFVFVVLGLAVLTAALWWRSDPASAIEHALAVLIITCPCALGLATPLALVASIGNAARSGILIKGGAVLEQLCRPARLVLDKTGTLTEGAMQVLNWTGDDSLQPAAATLERHSSHPVARALVDAFDTDHVPPSVERVEQTPGGGIRGIVCGEHIVIGSPQYMAQHRIEMPETLDAHRRQLAASGVTPVLIARNGIVEAIAGLGDPLKTDAATSLRKLREFDVSPEVLSGDDPAVVAHIGRQLGIDSSDLFGRVSPERKQEHVTAHNRAGTSVVMVGDGANDAAALAAADVGIAVRGGVEASMLAADVYLLRRGLAPLVELFEGARRTRSVIIRNLGISLGYNVIGVSLAMAGLINPIIAAVLMPISSLTVVAVALRSKTFSRTMTEMRS